MQIKTLDELEQIRSKCKRMVSHKALLSAGAAVVPIPGVDVGTDVAILLQLLPRINQSFGLSAEQIEHLSPELKKIIVVGSANFGVGMLGKIITPQRVLQLLQKLGVKKLAGKYATKYIPLIGSVVASGISYIVLRKVGNQHIDECFEIAKRIHLARNQPIRS